MINFQLLAHLPVYHLVHPVVSSLLVFLCKFVVVTYYVIDPSSLFPHNLHLLFCCVLSIPTLIRLVLMALFCAAIRRDSVTLSRFPFFSPVHILSCEMSLVSRLNRPKKKRCFSSNFFSGYFRSVDFRVVSIVSSVCDPSSFVLFYIVFTSSSRCVNVFSAGKSYYYYYYLESKNFRALFVILKNIRGGLFYSKSRKSCSLQVASSSQL